MTRDRRRMRVVLARMLVGMLVGMGGTFVARAQGDDWAPQRAVEFIVPTAAGSSMDALARLIQDLWQRHQLVPATMTVQARPGGGGALAWSYVSQRTGDGHYLAISGPTLLANDVLKVGTLKYQDVTPIAQLFTEYGAFAVSAGSAIRNARELADALKRPKPPSVAIAPGMGSSSHVALLRLARAAGVDPNALTVVPFKGANESVTAVLGGHVDVVIATMSVLAPQLEAGKLRALAVTAPQRLSAPYDNIPTWRQQGLDVVEGNWRGVVGAKSLPAAQVAFWSGRLAKLVGMEEWTANLVRNSWDADFRIGAEALQFLDAQYRELQTTLAAMRVDR